MTHRRKSFSGFSLLELLTVLTIISVFMGLLFPIGEKFVSKSRRMADATHLRQLALAYLDYISEDENNFQKFNRVKNAYDWANLLAQSGYINDPHLYVAQQDPELSRVQEFPLQIVADSKPDPGMHDTAFRKLPISWIFITGIPRNAPLHTTPLAYSRGLKISTGHWDKNSVYGPQGGFVVFLDGHVKFFSSLENRLIDYKTGQATSYIRQAVPEFSHAYDGHGRVW
ncbi:MAG: type II secretion system GspH family protein [Puniceicoccales bacterium]|jgi:prepilin-type N-terminal cleavage/methylation domain-containing protein|nr:type II secretion system GspH family protein [Puniceicoccales bacterium]